MEANASSALVPSNLQPPNITLPLPLRRRPNITLIPLSLLDMGHDANLVTGVGRTMFGRGQVIQKTIDATTGRTVFAAGCDPRSDGHAAAQI